MPEDNNPLTQIEDKKAQGDMGALGLNVYKGAREAGATRTEAFLITRAFFAGVAGANLETEEGDEEQ